MEPLPDVVTTELIADIRENYVLRWEGTHGWSHWLRVCENGLHIARQNGADQQVVALFAFTHDMARESESSDPEHGLRAAERIRDLLQGKLIHLEGHALDWLIEAVANHTLGYTKAALTVQTCWDADRLDLGRVGIRPSEYRLCTQEARNPETISWAYERSRRQV